MTRYTKTMMEALSEVRYNSYKLQEATIDLRDHDMTDPDFQKLIKKVKLKAKELKGDDGTTVTGSAKDIEKMLSTMYGNDWKDMYKQKGQKFIELEQVEIEEAKEVLSRFRDDKLKKSVMSLAKQKGLKVKDMGDKIEISGNGRKVMDLTLAVQKHDVKIEELEEKLGKDADAGDYIDDFKKSDAPQFKGKSDKKKRDMAIAAYLDAKDKKEEVELDEAKYDLYHKDFSSAMQHAYAMAKKLHGITIDPKEIDNKVATGPRKPGTGKTNTYRLKGDKGNIQIQVYNKGGSKPFELNMYKEEVQVDEALKYHFAVVDPEGKVAGMSTSEREAKDIASRHKGKVVKLKKPMATKKGDMMINRPLKEGTWALPDSPKSKAALKKLMSKPIKLGKEGDTAANLMYSLIGDDELFDDLYVAGKKNPNGDARDVIKKAMKRLGIKEEDEKKPDKPDSAKAVDQARDDKKKTRIAQLQLQIAKASEMINKLNSQEKPDA